MATDNLSLQDAGSIPEIPVEIVAGEGVLAREPCWENYKVQLSLQKQRTIPVMENLVKLPLDKWRSRDNMFSNAQQQKVPERFRFTTRKGRRMSNLTVAVAYDNGHFAVTIAAGEADFVVGDIFTVTVAAGTNAGKYRAYGADNTDGSGIARVILGRDVDATAADVKAFAYAGGVFKRSALTGIDDAAVEALADRGIFVK